MVFVFGVGCWVYVYLVSPPFFPGQAKYGPKSEHLISPDVGQVIG